MKTWLSKQKTDTTATLAINKLIIDANWQSTHTIQTDSLIYMVTKLTITPQKFDDPTKTVDRYLVIIKSNSGIKEGFLYEIFGNVTQLSQNADEYIVNYNKNFSIPFTGNLSKLTLQSGLKESETYNQGQLGNRAVVISRKHKSSLSIQNTKKTTDVDQNCIDWYLQNYVNGALVSEEFLFRMCSCDAPTQSDAIRDHLGIMKVFLRPNCDTSGSTGSTSPSLDDLFNSDPEFEEFYYNMSDAEKLLAIQHPVFAFDVYFNAKTALQVANSLYPGEQHNTAADAFRHAVLNALNEKDMGYDMAKLFADAHEDIPNNPSN